MNAPPAMVFSMFFTVVLLVVTAYFLLGGLPLLVLNHDTPLDARFVRGFFNAYYLVVMPAAAGAAISFAFLGKPAFALGAVLIVGVAAVLRARLMPAMDFLRDRIVEQHAGAVRRFRAFHVTALLVNLAQLALIVWSLVALKL